MARIVWVFCQWCRSRRGLFTTQFLQGDRRNIAPTKRPRGESNRDRRRPSGGCASRHDEPASGGMRTKALSRSRFRRPNRIAPTAKRPINPKRCTAKSSSPATIRSKPANATTMLMRRTLRDTRIQPAPPICITATCATLLANSGFNLTTPRGGLPLGRSRRHPASLPLPAGHSGGPQTPKSDPPATRLAESGEPSIRMVPTSPRLSVSGRSGL